MNDFQMSFLANDRQAALRAEADRHRTARAADQARTRSRSARPRRTWLGLGLGLLRGRVAVS